MAKTIMDIQKEIINGTFTVKPSITEEMSMKERRIARNLAEDIEDDKIIEAFESETGFNKKQLQIMLRIAKDRGESSGWFSIFQELEEIVFMVKEVKAAGMNKVKF